MLFFILLNLPVASYCSAVFIAAFSFQFQILSKREHLLVVPTENLEDVRKNITAAKQADAQETTTLENQELFEDNTDGYSAEVRYNNLAYKLE